MSVNNNTHEKGNVANQSVKINVNDNKERKMKNSLSCNNILDNNNNNQLLQSDTKNQTYTTNINNNNKELELNNNNNSNNNNNDDNEPLEIDNNNHNINNNDNESDNDSNESVIDLTLFQPFSAIKLSDAKLKNSKIQKAIKLYNDIKSKLNTLFSKHEPTTPDAINADLSLMLNLLEGLNSVLTIIINNQRLLPSKSKNASNKNLYQQQNPIITQKQAENDQKLIKVYQKRYEQAKQRLNEINNETYLKQLDTKLNQLNIDIANLEKENKRLKTEQKISEKKFQHQITPSSVSEHISKLLQENERYCKEKEMLSQKIENNLKTIETNNTKISNLEEQIKQLDKSAHEQFQFDEYEKNIANARKILDMKRKEIINTKKAIVVLDKAKKSHNVQYEMIFKKNEERIQKLMNEKTSLQEFVKITSDALDKMRMKDDYTIMKKQKSYINSDNTFLTSGLPEVNNNVIKKSTSVNDYVNISETNLHTNKSQREMKADVLQSLTMKQKNEEETTHNKSQNRINQDNKVIVIKQNMKPKFSFTNQKVLNQINSDVNYNNANNDKEKESDIKEDIQINDDTKDKVDDNNNNNNEQNEEHIEANNIKISENQRSRVLNTVDINSDKEDKESELLPYEEEDNNQNILNDEIDFDNQQDLNAFNQYNYNLEMGKKKYIEDEIEDDDI